MNEADYIRIKDAAKYWAYYHRKRVRIEKLPLPDDMCRVRITLISQHRNREFSL